MKVNLILFKKDGTVMLFPLPSTVTVIGRYRGCDLCIPLMLVSRKHCELYIYQGKLTVRDLSSRNGTFLNGEKVDEAHIQAGDLLKIGPFTFGIQIDEIPKDIGSMQPEDIPVRMHPPVPAPSLQADETFESMIQDFSDFDLNQTLSPDHSVDIDLI